MLRKFSKFFVIAVITVLSVLCIISAIQIGIFFYATRDTRMSKEDIFEYVTKNQAVLEQNIKDFAAKNPISLEATEDYTAYPECSGIDRAFAYDNRIQFNCGGYGIGSATGYAGFYYLLTDEPVGENMSALGYGGYGINRKFIPKNNGWYYHETNGDNSVYIENITGKFYYYSEEY